LHGFTLLSSRVTTSCTTNQLNMNWQLNWVIDDLPLRNFFVHGLDLRRGHEANPQAGHWSNSPFTFRTFVSAESNEVHVHVPCSQLWLQTVGGLTSVYKLLRKLERLDHVTTLNIGVWPLCSSSYSLDPSVQYMSVNLYSLEQCNFNFSDPFIFHPSHAGVIRQSRKMVSFGY